MHLHPESFAGLPSKSNISILTETNSEHKFTAFQRKISLLEGVVVLLRTELLCLLGGVECLTSESVKCTSLALEGIDDVHGSHGLPLGMLGVGDSITDHVLQENFENTAGLLVDEAGDSLDSTTASQAADGRLGDTLDVITEHLTVTLRTSLSQSLSSFAASRHVSRSDEICKLKFRRIFQVFIEK